MASEATKADELLTQDGPLTLDECAEFLALCRATVSALVKHGQLPCVRIGRSVRVPRRSVIAFAERCLEPPGAGVGEG